MPEEPARQPLIWLCICGWLGLASQMALGYRCPWCNEFERIAIVVTPKAPPWLMLPRV
jgi:hypothetical protein